MCHAEDALHRSAIGPASSSIIEPRALAIAALRRWYEEHPAGGPTRLEDVETPSTSPIGPEPALSSTPRELCTSFRHSGWSGRRAATLSAFHRTGQKRSRVDRFCSCGSNAWVLRAKSQPDRYRVASDRCKDRWCEPCQRERRQTVCANLRAQMPPGAVRHLTLTLKSRPEPLAAQLDRLHSCFARLRAQPSFRKRLAGGLTFVELTVNASTGLWHPHLHVLCQGTFIPVDELRHTWQNITGDSYIVDIKLLHNAEQAAMYVAKYAGKAVPSCVWQSPQHFDEAIVALAGRRTFNAFGTWKKLSLSRPPADDLEWEPVATLAQLIARANNGDAAAQRVLNYLRRIDADEPIDVAVNASGQPSLPGLFTGPPG